MHIDNILQERGERYGQFEHNAATSQALKKVLHMHDNWFNLNYDQREALDMICSKMARIMNGDPNYVDSWADIAGYATLVANRLK
jgi:dGTP triphosphohydrolase